MRPTQKQTKDTELTNLVTYQKILPKTDSIKSNCRRLIRFQLKMSKTQKCISQRILEKSPKKKNTEKPKTKKKFSLVRTGSSKSMQMTSFLRPRPPFLSSSIRRSLSRNSRKQKLYFNDYKMYNGFEKFTTKLSVSVREEIPNINT